MATNDYSPASVGDGRNDGDPRTFLYQGKMVDPRTVQGIGGTTYAGPADANGYIQGQAPANAQPAPTYSQTPSPAPSPAANQPASAPSSGGAVWGGSSPAAPAPAPIVAAPAPGGAVWGGSNPGAPAAAPGAAPATARSTR